MRARLSQPEQEFPLKSVGVTAPFDAAGPGVGEIVLRRRGELGMTLQRLAELAGCTKGYLSEIENGRRSKAPGAGLLAQLEAALELEPGSLAEAAAWSAAPASLREKVAAASSGAARRAVLMLAGPRTGGVGRSLDALYQSGVLRSLAERADPGGETAREMERGDNVVAGPRDQGGREMRPARRVPIINSVAAGYPAEFTDLGYPVGVADDYLPAGACADPDAFAARVVGDSMEPEYREGDIVVFSPARGVRDGDDCYARLGPREDMGGGAQGGDAGGLEGATFKRVFFETGADGGEVIRLVPLNGRYGARVVAREEVAGLYAAVSVTRAIGGGAAG